MKWLAEVNELKEFWEKACRGQLRRLDLHKQPVLGFIFIFILEMFILLSFTFGLLCCITKLWNSPVNEKTSRFHLCSCWFTPDDSSFLRKCIWFWDMDILSWPPLVIVTMHGDGRKSVLPKCVYLSPHSWGDDGIMYCVKAKEMVH